MRIDMKTKVEKLTKKFCDECVEIIRKGGIVSFPTETVYGLGADATNAEAVRKIFSPFSLPLHRIKNGEPQPLNKEIRYRIQDKLSSESSIYLIKEFSHSCP